MIRVVIERCAEDGRITAFTVSGHAEYAKPGKDIVCAGVSAVTVGTVNSVEALTGVQLPNEMRHGLLRVEVPDDMEQEISTKVQWLLESMVVMLNSIRETYGKYIAMHQQLREKRR